MVTRFFDPAFHPGGEAAGVIDVKITELQASAQGIPQTFINFFLHEGFQRFAHDFGVSRFIPVGTADANDPGVGWIWPAFSS
jgi:hypothetical protein